MVSKRKLDEKAKIEADAILRQKHYNEWYTIYKKTLNRLNLTNRSNKKIMESIYKENK